ncbi:unnamed protein product [Symbiodinium sp. KB8]|nr:unnamed protein product [Symbiodinium sp. KB8]
MAPKKSAALPKVTHAVRSRISSLMAVQAPSSDSDGDEEEGVEALNSDNADAMIEGTAGGNVEERKEYLEDRAPGVATRGERQQVLTPTVVEAYEGAETPYSPNDYTYEYQYQGAGHAEETKARDSEGRREEEGEEAPSTDGWGAVAAEEEAKNHADDAYDEMDIRQYYKPLTPADIQKQVVKLTEIFEFCDRDDSESISVVEFSILCKLLRNGRSKISGNLKAQLELFHAVDADGSGSVSKEEFLSALSEEPDPELRMWIDDVIHQLNRMRA